MAIAIEDKIRICGSVESGAKITPMRAAKIKEVEIIDVHTNERRKRRNLIIVVMILRVRNAVNNAKQSLFRGFIVLK
jgi:hypothetical protein